MTATQRLDEDSARLAELGYESEFSREMSLRANFALGFTYLSPVVGVYTLFAFALAEAGPPMIWSFVIVGLVLSTAVVLVAGVLYMLAARPWERSTAAAGDAVEGGA